MLLGYSFLFVQNMKIFHISLDFLKFIHFSYCTSSSQMKEKKKKKTNFVLPYEILLQIQCFKRNRNKVKSAVFSLHIYTFVYIISSLLFFLYMHKTMQQKPFQFFVMIQQPVYYFVIWIQSHYKLYLALAMKKKMPFRLSVVFSVTKTLAFISMKESCDTTTSLVLWRKQIFNTHMRLLTTKMLLLVLSLSTKKYVMRFSLCKF